MPPPGVGFQEEGAARAAALEQLRGWSGSSRGPVLPELSDRRAQARMACLSPARLASAGLGSSE